MHDIAKKFGNKLRAKRTDLGITQEQLVYASNKNSYQITL